MSLQERLRAARRQLFSGREAEQKLFHSALAAAELPFNLLYIFGPGGVGKTTLVRHLRRLGQAADVPVYYIDSRHITATPSQLLEAIGSEMGVKPSAVTQELAQLSQRAVLILDTYETILSLDRWLREEFLPQLSGELLTIIASRYRPSAGWRADPGWQAVLHTISLRNLTRHECQSYLEQRQIPDTQRQAVISFTHGHPLALSLVADAYAERPDFDFTDGSNTDIIKTLLERFIENVASPAHRVALEASALVRAMTEPLLAKMLGTADAHELFDWLRTLSFIDIEPRGLFPHDLARQVLTADLRWRNREWYKELHNRARSYYATQLQETHGEEQQACLIDYIYLHRDNAVVRPFFEQLQTKGQGSANSVPITAAGPEFEEIVALVRKFEGDESAAFAKHWCEHQPESVQVFYDAKGALSGFMFVLALEKASEEARAADPATAAAWEHLKQNAPLRKGERFTFFRFWMAADTYQMISPVQSLIAVSAIRHYLTTPSLAFSIFPVAEPDFWMMLFTYADLHHEPALDFTIGERTYGAFVHDWRVVSAPAWLDLLAERETARSPQSIQPPKVTTPLVVLNREDFETAVRDALNDFTRPDLLAQNLLLRSRIVREGAEEDNQQAAVKKLLTVIQQAADSLNHNPKEQKFYRALYHTYFQPAPTQETAAEILDVPYSTFRRHLKRGIDQLTDILWQQEIG